MKLWKLKQSFMNSFLDKYNNVFLCTNEIVREVFHCFGEKKRKHLCKTSLLIWSKTVLKIHVQKNVQNIARGVIINVTTEHSSKNDVNFGSTHSPYVCRYSNVDHTRCWLELIPFGFCVQQIAQAVQGQQRKSHCFFFT